MKLTITNVKQTLAAAAFRPEDPGPLKAALDGATPLYLMQRAVEFIREAQISEGETQERSLRMAMSLTAAASVLLKAEIPKQTYRESRAQGKCGMVFIGSDNISHLCELDIHSVDVKHQKSYENETIYPKL